MKKYIIGALIGFVLSLGVGAHAEVISLINKTVDGMFPVTIDGKPLGDAIVVDNKTYLPVREFGEAVGYKVTFTDTREVVMTKNYVPTPIPTPTASTSGYTPEKRQKLVDLQEKSRSMIDELEILYIPIKKHNTEKATNADLKDDAVYLQAKKIFEDKQAELAGVDKQIQDILKEIQAQ